MWQVIVPVKGSDAGKSRLQVSPSLRARYAEAMAADTLGAVRACSLVREVVALVASQPDRPVLYSADRLLVQPPGLQLNDAVTWALDVVPADEETAGTAVVVADLPALRTSELGRVLAEAEVHDLSIVADRHGSGTTLVAAGAGSLLVTRFGPDSARQHVDAGATRLDERLAVEPIAGLRCDVDTVEDLVEARSLGLGAATQALEAGLSSPT